MINSALNLAYHVIVALLILALGFNTLLLKEPRKQLMSAVVLLPLLLRFLNLK